MVDGLYSRTHPIDQKVPPQEQQRWRRARRREDPDCPLEVKLASPYPKELSCPWPISIISKRAQFAPLAWPEWWSDWWVWGCSSSPQVQFPLWTGWQWSHPIDSTCPSDIAEFQVHKLSSLLPLWRHLWRRNWIVSVHRRVPIIIKPLIKTFPFILITDQRHFIILQGHGDDIQSNHQGNDDIKIFSGHNVVNDHSKVGISNVIWSLPHFCDGGGGVWVKNYKRKTLDEEKLDKNNLISWPQT